VIDVSQTIDTDSEALPPARCNIFSFCRSHYRLVPIDRLSRRPLPWAMVNWHNWICPYRVWLSCLSFPFHFSAPTSLCRLLSLNLSTMAPAALNSVWPSFAAGLFSPWWVALLVEPAFTSLSFHGLPEIFSPFNCWCDACFCFLWTAGCGVDLILHRPPLSLG